MANALFSNSFLDEDYEEDFDEYDDDFEDVEFMTKDQAEQREKAEEAKIVKAKSTTPDADFERIKNSIKRPV